MADEALILSVATYNIHRGLGCDRRLDLERVAAVIADLDADVVALQEVEMPASAELLERLHRLGYASILGPTMVSEHASYGNALLSRLPVRTYRRCDLSYPGREPRGLIEAELGLGRAGASGQGAGQGAGLVCLATHLGLRARERVAQIARLAERIDHHQDRGRGRTPIVLLGDFNEWRHRPGRLKPIDIGLRATPARSSYPGVWPLLPLDRIWVGGGLRLRTLEAVGAGAARWASDHRPVRALLQLDVTGAG